MVIPRMGLVGCGFDPWLGHTYDYRNGRHLDLIPLPRNSHPSGYDEHWDIKICTMQTRFTALENSNFGDFWDVKIFFTLFCFGFFFSAFFVFASQNKTAYFSRFF